MADQKITALAALTGAGAATGDLLPVVDVSDATMAASGTDKKISIAELLIGLAALPLAGGTMTGTITSTFGSVTTSKPFLTCTQTWDANVNFEGIKVNVTEGSNFGVGSNLINLQKDGTVRFRVGGNTAGGTIEIVCGGAVHHRDDEWVLSQFGLKLGKTVPVVWSSTDFTVGTADTGLYRNAAGVVEVNNGTAGTFRDLKLRDLIATAALNVQGAAASVGSGISYGGATRTTIGANGAASALTANPLGYIDAYVGSTAVQIPYYTRGA